MVSGAGRSADADRRWSRLTAFTLLLGGCGLLIVPDSTRVAISEAMLELTVETSAIVRSVATEAGAESEPSIAEVPSQSFENTSAALRVRMAALQAENERLRVQLALPGPIRRGLSEAYSLLDCEVLARGRADSAIPPLLSSKAGEPLSGVVISLPESVASTSTEAGLDDALVMDGRVILGRVDSSSGRTARVTTVGAPEFRASVTIARPSGDAMSILTDGVLEGSTRGPARIKFVPSDIAIRAGDLVLSSASDALPGTCVYGTVGNAEVAAGAPHWDIELQPALTFSNSRHVQVLSLRTAAASNEGRP
ncbi:Cell shape-determining protein MreC [Stratiformator vulcanicus]|uniref:Cell shape-determining protein MreC n=2 Tax=Stratiformator vulcanicus TaxID=2527980 RepID=A0A517R3L6_9PLAN|nr:Cell shape-determining protein MreC [Stratiformator vulcanicus]